jgi:predicted GNAT family acetyltransferase
MTIMIMDDSPAKSAEAWLQSQATLAEAVPGGTLERGPAGALMSLTTALIPALNGVLDISDGPDPREITALAALAAERATTPWSIQVRAEPSAEIRRIAASHGLVQESTYALMVLNLNEETAAPPPSREVNIRAVDGLEHKVYADTLAAGFETPLDVFGNLPSPRVLDAAGVTAYLAEHEGTPVGTGLANTFGDCVGLFNIATPPQYRRRGYARTMTRSMLSDAHANGQRIAFLSPSLEGLPLYASIGFRTVHDFTCFTAP